MNQMGGCTMEKLLGSRRHDRFGSAFIEKSQPALYHKVVKFLRLHESGNRGKRSALLLCQAKHGYSFTRQSRERHLGGRRGPCFEPDVGNDLGCQERIL